MNRFRLIDEVSIYLHDRNNCHISYLLCGLFFNRTLSIHATDGMNRTFSVPSPVLRLKVA